MGSQEKEPEIRTLTIGRHVGHSLVRHHSLRSPVHHLGIRTGVEAALGAHAGKLLLLIEHHLLLVRLAALLLGSTLVVKLLLPGIIETVPALEHGWLHRRARDLADVVRVFGSAVFSDWCRKIHSLYFSGVLYRYSIGGERVKGRTGAYRDNELVDSGCLPLCSGVAQVRVVLRANGRVASVALQRCFLREFW